jgi:hypothetical protein
MVLKRPGFNCMRYIFMWSILTVYIPSMHADESIQNAFKEVTQKIKTVWDGAGSMLKGMGQSFGVVDSSYKYSYHVYNDAAVPIFVAEERLTGLLGATFQGEIKKGLTIGPNADSGEAFYNRPLYISVWICVETSDEQKKIQKYAKSSQEWAGWGAIAGTVAGMGVASPLTAGLGASLGALAGSIATVETLKKYKLYEKNIYPWSPNDQNVYFYRAYTRQGTLYAEYLDLKKTTAGFLGQFYNATNANIMVEFKKDDVDYSATLEPNSFNMLQSSSKPYSIRPPANEKRGFQFYKDTISKDTMISFIPLASEGLAYMVNISTDPNRPSYAAGSPMMYTYEIYDSPDGIVVGTQGLSIGTYDQPTTGKIRDLNPAECHLWYQSAAQLQAINTKNGVEPNNLERAFDIPESVWISYKSHDYTYRKKINPGEVIDFAILRPLLQEQAFLYVVACASQDEKKVTLFLDRLHAGLLVQATRSDASQKAGNTRTAQIGTRGTIDDTKTTDGSGVIGTILLQDLFFAQGVGTGPFYYTIRPSILRIDQFVSNIWFDQRFYLQDKSNGNLTLNPEIFAELSTTLPQWIAQYTRDAAGVQSALKKYLQEKGNPGLFIDPSKSTQAREFNSQGTLLYNTLLQGPISIASYPVLKRSGTNYYVFALGDKPADWPDSNP